MVKGGGGEICMGNVMLAGDDNLVSLQIARKSCFFKIL